MSSGKIKILIIRLSSIGDILLSTPFVRQVRTRFSNAQIDFMVKLEFLELVKHNPHIDTIITVDTKGGKNELKRVKHKVKQQNYNYVFDLHKNFRSLYLTYNAKIDCIQRIKKDKLRQFLLVALKINRFDTVVSIPQRYLQVGQKFSLKDDGKGLELYWESAAERYIVNKLNDIGIFNKSEYITVAPGAGFFTKRWPVEYYREFINIIVAKKNYNICIIGGEQDKNISKQLSQSGRVTDFCGKLQLPETAVLIKQSKLLISNDSGLMHMSTAVGTPVLAIFGSTVRELGFFPYNARSRVVENNNLNCRPCSHIGRHSCPKKHFKCMRDILPEMVAGHFFEFENKLG